MVDLLWENIKTQSRIVVCELRNINYDEREYSILITSSLKSFFIFSYLKKGSKHSCSSNWFAQIAQYLIKSHRENIALHNLSRNWQYYCKSGVGSFSKLHSCWRMAELGIKILILVYYEAVDTIVTKEEISILIVIEMKL